MSATAAPAGLFAPSALFDCRDAYVRTVEELAAADERIVAVCNDSIGSSNNLLDTQPPPVITGLTGSVTGTETAAGTYDPIGRRFYSGFRLKL